MRTRIVGLLAILIISLPTAGFGQGVLININAAEHVALPRPIWPHPHPPRPMPAGSYRIKELSVEVRLNDQVARTQVSQTFVNTGSVPMEAVFVFPLPYDGAIDQLTLLVDGKEHPARLLPADEARKRYEEIVRKNRDPALLEWVGRGMFQTSVFPLPPGAERKVTLRYSQICRKDHGLTDFLFPLSTAKYTSQPLEKLEFRIAIESGADIKNVYSPTHTLDIKRPDNRHANISLSLANQIPASDFRLFYDVGPQPLGASVLSYRRDGADDGYFLLLATPEIKAADAQRTAKTVLFVLDRSGSMSGEKIQQAKEALKFVLNNLAEGDLFNIIAYDSRVESFKPELQRVDAAARASALGFVDGLFAGGSTNIDGALQTALGQLTDSSRPNYVIFLTDGLATDGEKNEAKIVATAAARNKVRARLFTFGVGYNVNSLLLDKLARENFGQSEYVRPSEDIEAHVSSLYNRIGSPVLTDVSMQFELEGLAAGRSATNRVYPAQAYDLFAGQQLVVVGRYSQAGAAKLTISGKVGGAQQKFEFAAPFVERSADESNNFIEKLWATRRVGQIIDELDLKGRNEELVKELVELSTKHGILTPYTSFLADETTDRHDVALNVREAGRGLDALKVAAGEGGVSQRAAKNELQYAATPNLAPADAAPGQARAYYYDAKQDKRVAVDTVQQVGSKTFFRRGNRWIDGSLTKDQESKAIQLERFSPDYFKLIDRHGVDTARYLSIDEPVTIELGGQAYAF